MNEALALEFGNHKRASEKPELLKQLIAKDVKHGYGLVLPLFKITRIPNLLLAPMNIMNQNTIDEFGRIVGKDRLTHGQSIYEGFTLTLQIRSMRQTLSELGCGCTLKVPKQSHPCNKD
ncbi:hypothetical protein ACHAXR_001343 [Thalassiosira sp. AJA248-18]